MEKDLFGNIKKKRKSRAESFLIKRDKETFSKRLERINYLNKIVPKNASFLYSIELHYLISEATECFINGQFVSTIILSQSFFEQWLHNFFASKGFESEAKNGLKAILNVVEKNKYLPKSVINKIDEIRKIRNPFTHLKHYDYEYLLTRQTYMKLIEPDEYLLKKSKDAIGLIYQIPALLKFVS